MIISKKCTIGIIGGRGKTGSQFARLFKAHGFTVKVTGQRDMHRNLSLLRSCDIIIFALPLSRAANVIAAEVRHAVRPTQLLLDVSSLKFHETKAMLRGKGEVIGMHPLFGPSTDPRGETIILCPARAPKKTVQSLRDLLTSMEIRTLVMTPKAHDELMGTIQVIPHLKSFLMADVLRRRKADLSTVLKSATPTYELEFNVIGRFLDDHPDLYVPIIFRNPATVRILRLMHRIIGEYLSIAETGNLGDAEKRYQACQNYFKPFLKRSRAHSEACIQTLLSLS